jgi:protein gp37
MNDTKIDYVTKSWNPVTGCNHGCEYCYARKIANRFGNKYFPYGLDINELDEPLDGEKGKDPYPFGFLPTFHRYRLDEPQKIKKPQTIFVCSMADLFGDWVPDEWIQAVFKACEAAPQHMYLFLTKNPKRLCTLANKMELPQHQNFWYGTTVNTQKDLIYSGRLFDNTFISIEPILAHLYSGIGSFGMVKWIIVGAETGNRKDKIVPQKEWIDNIVETAKLTQASVFMKESLRTLMGEDFKQEFPEGVKLHG